MRKNKPIKKEILKKSIHGILLQGSASAGRQWTGPSGTQKIRPPPAKKHQFPSSTVFLLTENRKVL
jgi:hypothetical protein